MCGVSEEEREPISELLTATHQLLVSSNWGLLWSWGWRLADHRPSGSLSLSFKTQAIHPVVSILEEPLQAVSKPNPTPLQLYCKFIAQAPWQVDMPYGITWYATSLHPLKRL